MSAVPRAITLGVHVADALMRPAQVIPDGPADARAAPSPIGSSVAA